MATRCLSLFIFALCLACSAATGPSVPNKKPKTKTMRMIHRHSADSPLGLRFNSRTEAIRDLLAHDAVRHTSIGERLREQAKNRQKNRRLAVSSVPLRSAASVGTALYFVEMEMGTPPQKITLIADTGSDLTWANCNSKSASKTSNNSVFFDPFNALMSSSVSYMQCASKTCEYYTGKNDCQRAKLRNGVTVSSCKYLVSYLDKSVSEGPLMTDRLGGETVTVGCGTRNNGFATSAGVLGLGHGEISYPRQTQKSFSGVFSYCLGDYLKPSTIKSSLVFGHGGNRSLIRYTPSPLKNSYYYHLTVQGIAVGGRKLSVDTRKLAVDSAGKGGTIIDSGTSLSYLEKSVYEAVISALRAAIRYPNATTADPAGFSFCFDTKGVKDGAPLQAPEITFYLAGGAELKVPPQNYALQIEDEIRCVGLLPAGAGSQSIIGALFHQNVLVVYDLPNQRIGFAPQKCLK